MSDDDALTTVGPRLRTLREQRGLTLGQLSEGTGISVSTLSRLESGGRRPTLELLLPLARVHQVTLDELVDAPPTGDPRIHARPVQRHGMTMIPLTRRPGGLQAYKIVLPPDSPAHDRPRSQRVHEGYDWMYVLSGRLELWLGEKEFELHTGEVAEFDCRTPHWFGNPGPATAEVIGLFGPQGERMHVRARPAAR